MAEFEFSLTAAPKLGVDWSKNGNRIVERDDLAVVSIATPLGADAEVAKALKSGWNLASHLITRRRNVQYSELKSFLAIL